MLLKFLKNATPRFFYSSEICKKLKSPVFIFFSKVDIKPAGEGRVGKNLLRNAEDEEI